MRKKSAQKPEGNPLEVEVNSLKMQVNPPPAM
jgi:hypothetical protein